MFWWFLLLSLFSSTTAQNCDYQCNDNGGCTVKYVGLPRAGKISGSCFPQSFGGSCSGTPRECEDCNRAVSCGEGGGTLTTSPLGGSRPQVLGGSRPQVLGGSIPNPTPTPLVAAYPSVPQVNPIGGSRPHVFGGSRPKVLGGTRPQVNTLGGSRPKGNPFGGSRPQVNNYGDYNDYYDVGSSHNRGSQLDNVNSSSQCSVCSVEGSEVWNKLQDVANWLSEYSQNNNATKVNAPEVCLGAPTNTVNTATTTTTISTTGFQSFNNYETTFEEKILDMNAPLKEKNEEAMSEIYQSFKGIRNKNLKACTDHQSCDPQKKKFQEEVNLVLHGLASIQQQVLGYLDRRDRPRKKAPLKSLDQASLQAFLKKHGLRVARQAEEPVQRSTPEGRRLTKQIQITNDQLFEKLTSLEENINQQRPSCGSTSEKDLAKVKHLASEMTKKVGSESTAFRELKDAWRQVNKEDCWPKCDRKGGQCEDVCGPKGYCCRKGWKNKECPREADNASPDYHSCVKLTRTTSGDKMAGGAAAEIANPPPLETEFFRRCEPFFGYGFVDENGLTEHHDIVAAESFEECEKHCLENAVCEAWTYDKKDKFCYLKDAEMSNSLGDTWNMDLVSVRMESCIYQVDFCSVVMDGQILVNSDSDYMKQKSALAKHDIDTKCLEELATRIQKDKRTIKTCKTNKDEDEDRNELWIPIATLCKDELFKLSQEIINDHLSKSLDWRKMDKLSAEDHDAIMWIAKQELIDLVGEYSTMAHSLNIDTTKSRRTSAIVPGTSANGANVLAGSGLTNRRKVRDIEKASLIADDINAIEDDTTLEDSEKRQALQKKRDQGLQAIDASPVLTGEEKERAKKIFSQDPTERQDAKVNVDQELATLKGKSKWEKIKATALRRDQNNIRQAPNSAIAPTANTVNNGMTAAASSSNARSASQQSINSQQSSTSVNSQQSSTSVNSQQSATTTNSQQASTTPNGQQPPSTTATKSRGKRRRQAGKAAAGLGEAAAVGVGAVQKFIAGDPLNVVSGILDIAAMASVFIPPPVGLIAAGVFGVANAVLSIFSGPQGPSDLEIMTELLNEQTEVIKESIEQQTDILLESFKRLAKQNVRNTETIINSLKTTNFLLLVDEIQGSIQSLVVKVKHLQNYKHTCILDWSDIAGEASLEEAVVKLGRVGSFARRFCSSMGNLEFCGILIYQYILLAILRQRVQAEAIDIVRRSAFHNNHIKVRGLAAEFQAAQDMDWNLLQDVLLSRGNDTCHMGCAFDATGNFRFSTLAQKEFDCDPKATDCKPNKYQIKRTGMNPDQTAIVLRYLEKLGIDSPSEVFESNILAKDDPEKAKKFPDRLQNFCRSCYSNMPCEGDGDPSPGKKGVRRGGKDGPGTKCEEFTEPKKDEAKKLCATYWNEHKNNKRQIYIPAGNPDVKKRASDERSSQWWGYVNVENRCILTIYVEKDFKGTKEVIDRKSAYHDWLGNWWKNDVRSYECECA